MVDDAEVRQRRLGHDCPLPGAEHRFGQSDQRSLDGPRRVEIGCADRCYEPFGMSCSDIADHAEQSGGPTCEIRKVELVESTILGEGRRFHDGHCLEQVTLGILDGPDSRMRRHLDQRCCVDGHTSPRRNVVDHDG